MLDLATTGHGKGGFGWEASYQSVTASHSGVIRRIYRACDIAKAEHVNQSWVVRPFWIIAAFSQVDSTIRASNQQVLPKMIRSPSPLSRLRTLCTNPTAAKLRQRLLGIYLDSSANAVPSHKTFRTSPKTFHPPPSKSYKPALPPPPALRKSPASVPDRRPTCA